MKHEIYSEEEICKALKCGRAEKDKDAELWEADEDCVHVVRSACGGGVECMRCGGWMAF